jgi:hypothetical protein
MEGKEEKQRLRLCDMHDKQNTGLELVIFSDNSGTVEFTGNVPKMLLYLLHDATSNIGKITNLINSLIELAEGNDKIANGGTVEREFTCGKVEDIIKEIVDEPDSLKKTIAAKSFVDQVDNKEHLDKFLTAFKESADFWGKEKVLNYCESKIKHLNDKDEPTKEDKGELQRQRISLINDPQRSGIDVVVYADKSVDVEIHGNKAIALKCLIDDVKNHPEEMEDAEELLERVGQINLLKFKYGEKTDKYGVVAGTLDDAYDEVRKHPDPEERKVGIMSLIDQVPNEDELLAFLSKIQQDETLEYKKEILDYGAKRLHKFVPRRG